MVGTYPIIIKGENCGELKIVKEGAYTRFLADCQDYGEIIRLSVYGEGREGYLGVPMPKNGRLYLDKRLSPNAMRGFPEKIERCALAGEKPELPKVEVMEAVETPPRSIAEKDEKEELNCWYATTDGALVCRNGAQEMVALPPEDERVPADIPGQPRIIEGKEYLVYITKEV